MKIFAIKDNKADVFNRPFVEQSEATALRGIAAALYDDKIQLSIFPQDFDLYEIGSFDQDSGKLLPLMQPRFILGCVSIKKLTERNGQNVDE